MKATCISLWQYLFASCETFLKAYFCILLFSMKFSLVCYFHAWIGLWRFLWIPSYFFHEILIALLVWTLLYLFEKPQRFPKVRKALRISLLLGAIMSTIAVNSLVIATINKMGFIPVWSTFLFEADKAGWEIAQPLFTPFLVCAAVQVLIMVVGVIFSYHGNAYELLPLDPTMQSNMSSSGMKVYFKALLGILLYFAVCVALRPEDLVEPDVLSNPAINMLSELKEYISRAHDPANIKITLDKNHKEWFKHCKTLNDFFVQYRNHHQTCFPQNGYTTDFSFLKRTDKSPIKNVVVFFLESTRAEMMPFNYSSYFAKNTLRPTALEKQEITPFMDQLSKKSRYSTSAKSISSFTMKAMIGALCSAYPFPKSFAPEYDYKFYRTCLPELLKRYANMSTAYIQPMEIYFCHHYNLLKEKGFDYIVGAERMREGEFGKPPERYVNGLGYEDEPFRPIIKNWVKEQINNNKNFFLSYSASVSHMDFSTPSSWKKRKFSKKHTLNKYLNAVAYMDTFIENFIGDFEELNLLNSTLFVFLGDHGVSLGEHDVWYTTDIQYETQFNIPIFLYTENEEWNKRFPPGKIDQSWTTLDILPTILDALKFNGEEEESKEKYLYEGQSVLRKDYENRIQISLTNPGMHSVVLRENGKKVVLPGVEWRKEEIYDLNKDEFEVSEFEYKKVPLEFRRWIQEMKVMRELYVRKVAEWYQQAKTKADINPQ
eukprot:TRINITY_DN3588_c0_g1_i1.p1 TRINITY_DN3588_c0_g1~~TRINITY_DN3588_c0_g1_i1.p1  ORF type:complete len:714 (+),score=60.21 TRINITY_DN3588_c0_g1_i1:206-2347(+)